MAKKYIDAEMLIAELDASCMPIFENGISGCLGDTESIADVIRSQPAADVQEVRHGKWIRVDDTKCKCSCCDIIAFIALYPCGDKNYCPNCGVRMDGEENG